MSNLFLLRPPVDASLCEKSDVFSTVRAMEEARLWTNEFLDSHMGEHLTAVSRESALPIPNVAAG